ncbi:MAG: hypothetical protein HKN23_08410 [Verrucomicrobiales bacterium]|nr:hypothetical protein [Verrucomicrobiales bacterium]
MPFLPGGDPETDRRFAFSGPKILNQAISFPGNFRALETSKSLLPDHEIRKRKEPEGVVSRVPGGPFFDPKSGSDTKIQNYLTFRKKILSQH